MSTLKDTKFFKELDGRNTDNSTSYAGLLLLISKDIKLFLEYIKTTFPDFPDHGIEHSYRILDAVARILGNQICQLSDTEIFCFILSALFHDTGMSMVGFSSKNDMRTKHPQNAAIVIDKYFDKAFPALQSKNRIKSVIKFVCKAHGLDIQEMYKNPDFVAIDTINGDDVRNSILSVLLRIGDLLDLDEQRTSWLAREFFPQIFSDEAKAHNKRHLNVQKYHCSAKSLVVEVIASNITEYKIWNEWLGYLDNEILYANTHLKQEGFFFPGLSKQIKKDTNANYEIEEIHFELDKEGGMWEIISKSIYTNEFDFIREVIQNAIDATLVDAYLDLDIPLAFPSPRSWALSSRATPVYVCYSSSKHMLYIIDNGIGMNKPDLWNFLFKLSSTGYRNIKGRTFPFPSIAKYGIGFASCLINAEKIEIFTAKENEDAMQKVTLETGINLAFIESIPLDNYTGTTLAIKLKHPYPYEKIREYISKTFRYPSVAVSCLNIDNLEINAEQLNATNNFVSCIQKPYKLVGFSESITQMKDRITKPTLDTYNNLQDIRSEAEALIDWIEENSTSDPNYSDKRKHSAFKKKVSALQKNILCAKARDIFPSDLTTTTQKELFNNPDEIIHLIKMFTEALQQHISDCSAWLKKYPVFLSTISKCDVTIGGEWKFIVLDLDEKLRISNVQQYTSPVDLSQRTGFILIKHAYQQYDEGIEYAAVNGFLFNKGRICTRLTQIKGYHKVLHNEKREKNFILGSYDDYCNIDDAIRGECLDFSETFDDEPYFVEDNNGDLTMGMEFEPMSNVVSIIDNKLVLIRDINVHSSVRLSDYPGKINMLADILQINQPEYSDLLDDIDKLESADTVYCQDGIVIPFDANQLFPIGYMKLICNTTCSARIPLNVTRHEISRLRSDIDYWYDNTGSKIQQQIQAHTIKTLSDVKLDFDVADLSTSYSAEHPNDYSFPNSLHNLLKAKDT